MERRKKASRSPEGSVQLSTAPSLTYVGKEGNIGEEIAALNANLKENSEKLGSLRERNREMVAALQEKRRKLAEFDAIHEQKQAKILQNERLLAAQPRFPYIHDLKLRKSELISTENAQFATIKALIQRYIEEIERNETEFPSISHDFRIVELMNTQISLYRNQIQQRESQFLLFLAYFSKLEEELEAEISSLLVQRSSVGGFSQGKRVQREGKSEGNWSESAAEEKDNRVVLGAKESVSRGKDY